MRHENYNKPDTNSALAIKALTIGTFLGSLFSVLFLVLSSFLFIQMGTMSLPVVQGFTLASAVFGSFVSGYASLRICRTKGLIYGSFAGFIMFFLLTLIGFVVSRDHFTAFTCIKFILMLLMGAVGGVLGVNNRKN